MADPKTSFEQELPKKINADLAKDVNAIFCIEVTGDGGGTWTINLKDNPGVTEGDSGSSDCKLTLSREDWDTISEDPSAAMQLFFQGKLKVDGNAMLATKLQQVLE